MNENIKKLIELIKENPDLPVVPVVNEEVVGDDGSYYLGSFGLPYVEEYAVYNDRFFGDREEFKEHYFGYHDDELCEKFNYSPYISEYSVRNGHYTKEELEENEKHEAELDKYLDEIADKHFKKAISVYINAPE
ncbi:MAG: hypothetical protein ACI4F2_04120 [Acutalibacteraceae bacterium]